MLRKLVAWIKMQEAKRVGKGIGDAKMKSPITNKGHVQSFFVMTAIHHHQQSQKLYQWQLKLHRRAGQFCVKKGHLKCSPNSMLVTMEAL